MVFDINLVILDYNQAAEKILGVLADQVIGKKLAQAFPDNINFLVIDYIIKRQEVREIELKYYLEGHEKCLLVDGHRLKDQYGGNVGFVLAFQDISQIKDMQQKDYKIHQLEKQQAFILDSLDCGVLGIDEFSQINLYNQGAAKILGKNIAEVLGKNIYQAFPEILHKDKLLGKIFQDDIEVRNYPIKFFMSDKNIEIIINSMILRNEQGNRTGTIIVSTDVSDIRMQEHLLAQHESLTSVSRLAAGLAHEIRNPMTSIKGFVQLLQSKLKVGVETEYLDIILEELDRTNKLLSDFMLLAKPKKIEFKEININDILKNITEFMKSQALMHDVEIKSNLAKPLPKIKGETEKLKQVFINMIKNGIEAIPGKGTINIKTELINNEIWISFIDSGVGIPNSLKGKIFEMLYTTKETGTGLGLTVCSQIVKHHGGRIEVASEEGRGSTFKIILPAK